jgi:F-type H+-transporting ATPase subunit delta
MKGGVVARRYAKALLNLAGTGKTIEDTGEQLQQVAETFTDNVDFRTLMLQPKVRRQQKISIVDQLTRKMKCSDLVNKYCRYLTARHRFDIITNIAAAYSELASEKLGKATAHIVVSSKLSPKEERDLQKLLSDYTGKKISLEMVVDKDIIGGAVTSIGSLVLDGSIRNKLNLIRETITKGN